jgi:hypothetical protein
MFPGAENRFKMPANVNLEGMTLTERLIEGTILPHWIFTRATLTGTTWRDSKLVDCRFNEIDAPNSTFDQIDAEGKIDFTGARLAGGRFLNLTPVEAFSFARVDLTAAIFRGEGWLGVKENQFPGATLAASDGLTFSQTSENANRLDLGALKFPGLGEQTLAWIEGGGVAARLIKNNSVEVRDLASPDSGPRLERFSGEFQFASIHPMGLLAGRSTFLAVCDDRSLILRWNNSKLEAFPLPRGQKLAALTGHGEINDGVIIGGSLGLQFRQWCDGCGGDWLDDVSSLEESPVSILQKTTDGAVVCFGSRLVDYRHGEGKTWAASSEIRLPATPTLMANHDSTVVAAFEDESVMLLSRRFGWAVRARHKLSFSSIGTIAVEPSQSLIFVFGRWDEEPPCSAVCLIDGRNGKLLFYFRHASQPTAEEIMERQIKPRSAGTSLPEDLDKGIIDPKGPSIQSLLGNIKARFSNRTYEQSVPAEIEVRLGIEAVAKQLRIQYQDSRGGPDLPLTAEFSIQRPNGSRRSIPFDATFLSEVKNGEVVARFKTEFQVQGIHNLCGSILLAGHSIEIEPKPLAVRKQNPFSTMYPLRGETLFLFKGHEQISSYCSRFIDVGSTMVCGSRRMGKSSFLYHLAAQFREKRHDLAVALVSCDSFDKYRADLSYFEHLFQQLGDDEWTQRATGVRPAKYSFADVNEVQDALNRVKLSMENVLGKDAKLIILADEFNALTDGDEEDEELRAELLDRIGGLLTTNPWIRQIATGLPEIGALKSSKRSGMIRYLSHRRLLQPLNSRQIEELVTQPLLGRFEISARAMERVVRYSSGRPHDVQNLMYEAVNCAIEDKRHEIQEKDVEHALKLLVTFYESYLAPFIELESNQPEIADSWRNQCQCRPDLDRFYDSLNELPGDTDTFAPFYKWGFVRGDEGKQYNVPYALLSAWASRPQRRQS